MGGIKIRHIVCCCIAMFSLLLAGCGASGGVRERLDRATGLTWRAASEPGVYARTDPRFSRAARDYVYIGPVETNARGFREYFLWVGVGTTLDRGFLAPNGDRAEKLTLLVGDEPIDFELIPWSDLVAGTTSIEPYDPPVHPLAQFGARVTRDLIMRIRIGSPGTLRLTDTAGESQEFYAWSPLPGWSGFIANRGAR